MIPTLMIDNPNIHNLAEICSWNQSEGQTWCTRPEQQAATQASNYSDGPTATEPIDEKDGCQVSQCSFTSNHPKYIFFTSNQFLQMCPKLSNLSDLFNQTQIQFLKTIK